MDVEAPAKKDVHHHLQSSALIKKYVVTIAMHMVTIDKITYTSIMKPYT